MNRDLFQFARQYLAVVLMALVPVLLAAFVSSHYLTSLHESPTAPGVARHMS
ncbi:hypothetical protein [Ottowia testudinis]|uniref:Uncharacterized protein n=1 Tax=Ottowia testudinis TaxID=2816950 RepID=A0A975CJ41_9BURK|nr:hypothetical protein [Ottowia testudinis]QTD46031.1 hypothetical protein J1M35_03725 [Ottowia testudinis]